VIVLALSKLQKYYGSNMVLEDITFEVHSSEKVGIVGSNGCGKTTLFKIFMGIEEYEKGMLTIKKGATLGYLEQMPVYPESYKVIDVIKIAFEELDKIQEEMEVLEKRLTNSQETKLEDMLNKYSELQQRYESLGGYEKEEKLSKVCSGLKINDSFKEKNFSMLSGGEKTTVILGKILLQNPDILLLDEPSNHLDLEAMEWLEGYLKGYSGAVLIISHDRYFLNNVVTKIIEIEDRISKSYKGNYTDFINEKERVLQLEMEAYLNQQKKIKSMEDAIARLRDWGMRGDNEKFFKRAASMQKLLDKLERIDKPVLEKESISITGNIGGRSGNDVVVIKDLCKSFGDKPLLNNAELLIRNRETVALIGPNGCGKSTLIKILQGVEIADKGSASLGSSIKLGYLPQNIIFNDSDMSILECFREDIVITEGKAREYLAKYMFYGDSVFKKVKALSGGERCRLKLSMLMYNEVNFFILDEPTNHLDIDSREELEEFLKEFKGTLFFVSHDRYFINNVAKRVVELREGTLTSYEGNYEYYKEKSAEIMALQPVKKAIEVNKSKKPKREIISVYQKRYSGEFNKQKIEVQIEKLEQELRAIEEEINSLSDNYERLYRLYNMKLELQKNIDELLEEYII
jgi:ATP-binding cassette, subfamily F, member 3